VWVQKDWTKEWSTFGGGGRVFSTKSSRDFCLAGVVVSRKATDKLQLGLELFHQTADSSGTPASTSIGLGAIYDLNDTYHLLGTRPAALPGRSHHECRCTW
jgi:hypothetical protein